MRSVVERVGKVRAMKKIITAAIISAIALVAGVTAMTNSLMQFSDGFIIGIVVIGILAGSSTIIAVKDRSKHAWH